MEGTCGPTPLKDLVTCSYAIASQSLPPQWTPGSLAILLVCLRQSLRKLQRTLSTSKVKGADEEISVPPQNAKMWLWSIYTQNGPECLASKGRSRASRMSSNSWKGLPMKGHELPWTRQKSWRTNVGCKRLDLVVSHVFNVSFYNDLLFICCGWCEMMKINS
jgi:hypothetical protein